MNVVQKEYYRMLNNNETHMRIFASLGPLCVTLHIQMKKK